MSEIWPQIELGPSTDVTIWKEQERKRMDAMRKEPKFCDKCGEKLIVKIVIGGYDIYTGEEKVKSKRFTCPNYSSVMGRSNGHYSVIISNKKPPQVSSPEGGVL